VAIGTPCYMAPESARVGSATADHRVDVYAMGLLLYECLTGHKAIDGEPMDIFARQLTGNVVIPSVLKSAPNLPPELDDVIATACAREPDDRFQSAGELARALAAVPEIRAPVAAPKLRALDQVAREGGERIPTAHSITPLPPPAPAPEVSDSAVPAVSVPSSEIPIPAAEVVAPLEDEEPRRLGKPIAVVALLLVGAAGMAWWATARDDLVPVPKEVAQKAPPTAPATPMVHLKLIGVPKSARVYDSAHPDVELAVQDGAVLLPRGDKPVVLRFQAPGYERIQFQVVPEQDGEINFGLPH
jgi:serine/threonine-protein kinase